LNCIILLVGLRGEGYGCTLRMEWVRETRTTGKIK